MPRMPNLRQILKLAAVYGSLQSVIAAWRERPRDREEVTERVTDLVDVLAATGTIKESEADEINDVIRQASEALGFVRTQEVNPVPREGEDAAEGSTGDPYARTWDTDPRQTYEAVNLYKNGDQVAQTPGGKFTVTPAGQPVVGATRIGKFSAEAER